MKEKGQGSPETAPTTHKSNLNQGGVHKESNANAPLARSFHVERGRHGWSHEHLVKEFRSYIQDQQQLRRYGAEPTGIIHEKLTWLWGLGSAKGGGNKQEVGFWSPIQYAWGVVAYEYFKTDVIAQNEAVFGLSGYYQRTHESVIRLNDPQMQILDALTEAVGMPHHKGQVEIVIPENLRDYNKWHQDLVMRRRGLL